MEQSCQSAASGRRQRLASTASPQRYQVSLLGPLSPAGGRIPDPRTLLPGAASGPPTLTPSEQPAGAAPAGLLSPLLPYSARGPAVGRPHLLAGKRGSGLAPYHPGPEALFRMVSWYGGSSLMLPRLPLQ